MKLWKKILMVIAIILIIFVMLTLRKFMIFTDLNNKNKEQQSNTNVYTKVITEQITTEAYRKGNIVKIVNERNGIVMTQLTKPEYRIVYTDDGVNKTRNVYDSYYDRELWDENQNIILNFADYFTLSEKIWNSICSKIKTETVDGQEYYVLSGHNTRFMYDVNSIDLKVYINKNTGLPLKIVETIDENGNIRDKITMYEYQFDIVTDEDVAEFDSSEYEMQENS